MIRALLRLALVAAALAAALIPWPSHVIETVYSRGLYPAIQGLVTPVSNSAPFALLDVAAGLLLVMLAFRFRRNLKAAGFIGAVWRGLTGTVTLAAIIYLVFLLMWGLNYRRVPLESKIQFDAGRITHEALRQLGDRAVANVNSKIDAAHAVGTDDAALEKGFAAAQRMLGSSRSAVPGIPKPSLLGFYFRQAAIAGMTDPFFLEIILNPDALEIERPFVLAHEWAHLAGYANEAEAGFVAWLTCMQGNALTQYSAWLLMYEQVWWALPKAERAALAAKLDAGPRGDLQAINARYAKSSPIVRNAARDAYDTYLRANRVGEGIASYEGVVRLILGAGVGSGQAPQLR
jgi:hypothetical protein